ncbi:MAG: phosphotransferase [Aeromicrobium sp.]|uniref:phosphotransferase n=1 Tax=Aeromicrobium sp. TaxID=1871063 RepID=UPI0039E6AFFA
MTQWTPERVVTLAEAERLTGESDPRLLGEGWDNTVVAHRRLAFRFPRRSLALAGVEREIAWLPRLAERLPSPVPVPATTGAFGDPPWPFWGHELLPGEELARRPDVDRAAVAAQLGGFLRTLHDLPHDLAAPLPVDPNRRADATDRAARARELLAVLVADGVVEGDERREEWLARADAASVERRPLVVSHGDLYARHVLIDGDRITGVIDWGDVCLAPASVDLSVAFSLFDGADREAFWTAYGDIDPLTEVRARTMAVFSGAAYAHDLGDDVLLAEAVHGLARAVG